MTLVNTNLPAPVWFGLRLALTCGILALLWFAVDGAAALKAVANASVVWLCAAIGALLLQTALSAQRWRVTAAQLGQTLSPSFALREYFLSQALNQSLPGAVAGDAARAVRARGEQGLLVATQAVVFERLAGQVAMFLTLAVAFAFTDLTPGGLEWPSVWAASLWMIVLGALAVSVAALLLADVPNQPLAKLRRWVAPLVRALLARRVLPAQIVLGAAITVCNLAAFAFAARAVGIAMSPAEVAALVPVILFAMLVPFTVSGWGVREGAAALVLPLAGVAAADAVAASIVFGVAMWLAVLPGALLVSIR